jgi:hypothetical protein
MGFWGFGEARSHLFGSGYYIDNGLANGVYQGQILPANLADFGGAQPAKPHQLSPAALTLAEANYEPAYSPIVLAGLVGWLLKRGRGGEAADDRE